MSAHGAARCCSPVFSPLKAGPACAGLNDESFAGLSSQLLHPPCGYVNELSEAAVSRSYAESVARMTVASDMYAQTQTYPLTLQQHLVASHELHVIVHSQLFGRHA